MTPIRVREVQLVVFIASGVLLSFLMIPLLVLLARAIEADLWQQLEQPTVARYGTPVAQVPPLGLWRIGQD